MLRNYNFRSSKIATVNATVSFETEGDVQDQRARDRLEGDLMSSTDLSNEDPNGHLTHLAGLHLDDIHSADLSHLPEKRPVMAPGYKNIFSAENKLQHLHHVSVQDCPLPHRKPASSSVLPHGPMLIRLRRALQSSF